MSREPPHDANRPLLGAASGRPELVELGARPASATEPSSLTADVGRLRDEVGWAPRRSLEEAARETMAWWATAASAR